MNRMRTMTGGHRLVVPVTGTGTGRVGSARSASLIRWPGEIRNGLQQTSHVMFGPSAGPVLAKIDLGGVHSQRSVTGPRPCLCAASSTTRSHAAAALLIALISGANSLSVLSVMTGGDAAE
jgi:hypothetical protein